MAKQSLRAELNSKLKQEGIYNIATYGIEFSDESRRFQINDVCHARAKYDDYNDKNVPDNATITELSGLITPREDTNINKLRKWVKYILQESLFKDMFLTKSPQVAWRYGVQMDVNKSMSCVIAALMALREGWEFENILNNWCLLVNNGINKNIAYILARTLDNNLCINVFGGHQTIQGTSFDNLKVLLKKGLGQWDAPLSINRGKYKIWRTTRTEHYSPELTKFMEKNSKSIKKGWSEYSQLTKKQFIENAKEFEEMMK